MKHSLAIFLTMNMIQALYFPIFVRDQFGENQIEIEVPSDGTVRSIKDVLSALPPFANHPCYALSFHGQPLPDDALISETGITSECSLNCHPIGADVRGLQRRGFNQLEIDYFTDTLNRSGLNVYAVFWALDDVVYLHFIKRDLSDKYSHYALPGISWFTDNTTELKQFIKGCRRIFGGKGPVLGRKFEFQCEDHYEGVLVRVSGCSALFRRHQFMEKKVTNFMASCRNSSAPPLPKWTYIDCELCRVRL